ncbi:hypothetical protein GGR53DRAFT_509776 [Hypoxylon sp. FL1150]|nr:hypothetical protein GGR53DRAFT_509776 [Hypoxylon sp. FL1150]
MVYIARLLTMMDYSSVSCVYPETLYKLPREPTTCLPPPLDCSPDSYFQPQQLPPMELTSGPLNCRTLANPTNSCISPTSLVGPDCEVGTTISNYLALATYQEGSQTTVDSTDTDLEPRFRHNDDDDGLGREGDNPSMNYSRRSSRASNKTYSDGSGGDKRERNRMAASKCRKKQKLANNELQEKARIMGEKHHCLVAAKASLEEEVIGLKNELLLHGTCSYEPISEYLMQTAKNFVGSGGRKAEHPGGTEKVDRRAPFIARGQCAV